MILSFHPCFVGDRNILCAGRDPDAGDQAAIQEARAIILPQGCTLALYRMAKEYCSHVFPNYDARFRYPGKLGQIRLFRNLGAPFPETMLFEHVDQLKAGGFGPGTPPQDYPFVLKFNWGGEGDTVFLIRTPSDFRDMLGRAERYEKTGQAGFLIQAFVPTGNRTLRAVLMVERIITYWRAGPSADGFYANVSKGGRIDYEWTPEWQGLAADAVRRFSRRSGINLAGFDLVFSIAASRPEPLFLEINYYFGRQGLGGSEAYYEMLNVEIRKWIDGLDHPPGDTDAQ